MTSLSYDDWMLSFSGVVWGIGAGILYPHLTALSVEGVHSKDKAKVLSLFASSVDLGFALGPLSFGWLSQLLGIRSAFFIFAVFILVFSLDMILAINTKLSATAPVIIMKNINALVFILNGSKVKVNSSERSKFIALQLRKL